MANGTLPSPGEMRKILDYDSETGVLTWARNGKVAGWRDRNGYVRARVRGVNVGMHRAAWAIHYGKWPMGEIDHVNGNPADNRIANLRDVAHRENMKNKKRPANNASGVVGVRWHAGYGKWYAQIGGKHLGSFDALESAAAARSEAEAALGFHGNHGRR